MKTRYTVIKASRIEGCWLPIRFLGGCEECLKFLPKKGHKKCELPEPSKRRFAKDILFGVD